jgi:L-seryl-tRNA(Ser) seleniumtransferase
MLNAPAHEIEKRCMGIVDLVQSARICLSVVAVESVVGGGTAPSARLKSFAVSVRHTHLAADELLKKLRGCDPPIVGRISDSAVVFDLRTVPAHMDKTIVRALEQL